MGQRGRVIIGRLAGCMFILSLMLFAGAGAASAHGMAHGAFGASVPHATTIVEKKSPVAPGARHGCGFCLDCCVTGQCSAAGFVAADESGIALPPVSGEAAYAGHAGRNAAGLGTVPATPPPRLGA